MQSIALSNLELNACLSETAVQHESTIYVIMKLRGDYALLAISVHWTFCSDSSYSFRLQLWMSNLTSNVLTG